jgi:hypothetical protein
MSSKSENGKAETRVPDALSQTTARWSWAPYLAEAIGTFGLVFAGCGAIVIDRLSGGQITHVGVGLVFGLIITVMIYALGHISGAHFNPAVTLGFVLARHFPLRRLAGYWLPRRQQRETIPSKLLAKRETMTDTPDDITGTEPTRILFLCTHNSSRSQMAEGLLHARGGQRFRVFSAGTHPRAVHPLAVKAMAELGIDISERAGHRAKGIEEFANSRPWTW